MAKPAHKGQSGWQHGAFVKKREWWGWEEGVGKGRSGMVEEQEREREREESERVKERKSEHGSRRA